MPSAGQNRHLPKKPPLSKRADLFPFDPREGLDAARLHDIDRLAKVTGLAYLLPPLIPLWP